MVMIRKATPIIRLHPASVQLNIKLSWLGDGCWSLLIILSPPDFFHLGEAIFGYWQAAKSEIRVMIISVTQLVQKADSVISSSLCVVVLMVVLPLPW